MDITHDPIKNKINYQKHRIDLADVEGVFYDDRAITVEDRDHAEERFGRLLVAYHYRAKDEIRIISARPAEPHERRNYQED